MILQNFDTSKRIKRKQKKAHAFRMFTGVITPYINFIEAKTSEGVRAGINSLIIMKRFYVAFLCMASMVFFNACNQNKPTGPTDQPAEPGKWFTSADQVDLTVLDDETSKCWAIDIWCDGTTISRQILTSVPTLQTRTPVMH